MAATRLILSVCVASACLMTDAAMAFDQVFDPTVNGNVIENANKTQSLIEQGEEALGKLGEIRKQAQEVSDTLGEAATITLKVANFTKMGHRLRKDVFCLLPSKPDYGINFEDWVQGSLCDLAEEFRKKMVMSEEDTEGMEDYELNAIRRDIRSRRERLLADTTTRGAAQAISAQQEAKDIDAASNEMMLSLKAAKTVQERLTLLTQAQILNNQIAAAQLKVQAQQLAVMSAFAMKAGLSTDDFGSEAKDEESNTENNGGTQ